MKNSEFGWIFPVEIGNNVRVRNVPHCRSWSSRRTSRALPLALLCSRVRREKSAHEEERTCEGFGLKKEKRDVNQSTPVSNVKCQGPWPMGGIFQWELICGKNEEWKIASWNSWDKMRKFEEIFEDLRREKQSKRKEKGTKTCLRKKCLRKKEAPRKKRIVPCHGIDAKFPDRPLPRDPPRHIVGISRTAPCSERGNEFLRDRCRDTVHRSRRRSAVFPSIPRRNGDRRVSAAWKKPINQSTNQPIITLHILRLLFHYIMKRIPLTKRLSDCWR